MIIKKFINIFLILIVGVNVAYAELTFKEQCEAINFQVNGIVIKGIYYDIATLDNLGINLYEGYYSSSVLGLNGVLNPLSVYVFFHNMNMKDRFFDVLDIIDRPSHSRAVMELVTYAVFKRDDARVNICYINGTSIIVGIELPKHF